MQALGLKRPLLSLHKFNERSREERIISELADGKKVALVSDAGSPGISDPGGALVESVWEAGYRVESVPGPCAVIAGMGISGFAGDRFHFLGFLPVKRGQRAKMLDAAVSMECPVVIYESPYRILKLMDELNQRVPDRWVVVCRELTKKFEEAVRGSVVDVEERLKSKKPRGEYVVVLDVPPRKRSSREKDLSSRI